MKTERERINELEQALAGAIDYLRRLPVVPTTAALTEQLQRVLDNRVPEAVRPAPRAMVSEHITPAGIPMMRAELFGEQLVLSTETPRLTEAKLIGMLRAGYVMTLRPLRPGDPLTKLEKLRRSAE